MKKDYSQFLSRCRKRRSTTRTASIATAISAPPLSKTQQTRALATPPNSKPSTFKLTRNGRQVTTLKTFLFHSWRCVRIYLYFFIHNFFQGNVFIYYGLTNFYQNHRRYVKSRDDSQLLGDITKDPSSDCDPFDLDDSNKPYVPCGAIANSLFSGTVASWNE